MSVSRIIAGAVALALGAAVVTALAGATPEENADRPAAVAKTDQPAAKVAPLAAKIDQPAANAAASAHLCLSEGAVAVRLPVAGASHPPRDPRFAPRRMKPAFNSPKPCRRAGRVI